MNSLYLSTIKDMITEITRGVKVSVTTSYQPQYSSPAQFHYVFTYKIEIKNCSNDTVQLLKRHWHIYDANGEIKEVEGDGVIGQQPMLAPGETHEYISGCNLKSGIGKMHGTYLFERLVDGKLFDVQIPEFTLIVPFKLN